MLWQHTVLTLGLWVQLLLIGDSGVGKSCLLLRFAVSACPAHLNRHSAWVWCLLAFQRSVVSNSKLGALRLSVPRVTYTGLLGCTHTLVAHLAG